jgi:hypothetical protein
MLADAKVFKGPFLEDARWHSSPGRKSCIATVLEKSAQQKTTLQRFHVFLKACGSSLSIGDGVAARSDIDREDR